MTANGQIVDAIEPETIAEIMTKEEKQFMAWVSATVKLENFGQPFCYIGCEACNKGTAAEVNEVFYCTQCEKDHLAKERPLFEVNISDNMGTVITAIFGAMIEKHFDVVATDIIKARQTGEISVLQAIAAFSSDEKHLVQLRVKTNEFRGQATKRFTIAVIKKKEANVDAAKMTQLESSAKLVEKDVTKAIDKGKQKVGSSANSGALDVTDATLRVISLTRPAKGIVINEPSMVSKAMSTTHALPISLMPDVPAQST